MQRRRFVQLAGASVAGFVGIGLAATGWQSGALNSGRLSASAQSLLRAIGKAVLAGVLPLDADAQDKALDVHLVRVQATIDGLSPAGRAELALLLSLLLHPLGRQGIARLSKSWPTASDEEVNSALDAMRFSRLAARRQAYGGLRDLTNAAYFADPAAWSALDYPGPLDV